MLDIAISAIRRHAVAFAAVFLALVGSAYAATSIPGPGGVIHSCYKKRSGSLRVVPAGARCHRRERALSFDQRGPQGPRGARGPRGLTGPRGGQGPKGSTGAGGTNGATNVVVRTAGPTALLTDGSAHDYPVSCNGAERATGGGYILSGTGPTVLGTRPNPASGVPTSWVARIANSTAGLDVSIYVICASP